MQVPLVRLGMFDECETRLTLSTTAKRCPSRRFRVYLLGKKFKLVTDCAAVRMALKKDMDSRVARWSLELEEYEYVQEHRNAERMQHADALSRAMVIATTVSAQTSE